MIKLSHIRIVLYAACALCLFLFARATGAELKLYDSMHYKGKPASVKLGCIRFKGVYQWALHGGGQPGGTTPYDKPSKWYRHWARKMADEGETVVWLNLEAWNFDLRLGDATAEKRMQNRLSTLALFRAVAPSVEWQVYNWTVDDQSLYWSFVIDKVSVERWWAWQRFNERFALPVLQAQHSIFPDCYLRKAYTDKRWQRTEGSVIREIQRLVDKPIYAVLRFRYPTGDGPMSKGKGPHLWIPPEQLRMAVEYLKGLGVDGFMLWSPPWPKARVPWKGKPRKLFEIIQEAVEHA